MTTVRSVEAMAVQVGRRLAIVGKSPMRRAPQTYSRGQSKSTEGARRIYTEDGQDLDTRKIAPVRWVIQDLLPEGAHMLAGKPKKGKSFLSMEWALDVVNGSPVFGQYTVEQGGVIYFNLDDPSEGRLQARQRELLRGRKGRELLWVLPGMQGEGGIPTVYESPGLMDSLNLVLEEYPNLKLVIIDTWGRVSKSKGRGEDWYSQDVQEITKVQRWAHQNHVAVLAIHHTRKTASDTDELDNLLGSIGVSGTFDNILVLTRSEKSKNAKLYGRGRDYKDDIELNLYQEDSGAWALQQSKPVLTPEKQAIIDLLRDKAPMAARSIADALEKGLPGIQKHLQELRSAGWIAPAGSGKDTMWVLGMAAMPVTPI